MDEPANWDDTVVLDYKGFVGDCAGMAADIFESYEVTIVSGLILGIALWGTLTQKWVMLGAAVLAFILTIILRLCGAHRAFSRLREPIALWSVLPLELTVVWRRLATAVRYLFASPYDFTTHKQ